MPVAVRTVEQHHFALVSFAFEKFEQEILRAARFGEKQCFLVGAQLLQFLETFFE